MSDDLEIISLKLLKILYQYSQQDPGTGMDEKALADRFDFKNQKQGLQTVQKALTNMRKLALVRSLGEGEYRISSRGIEHYERFKFIKGADENESLPSNIVIYGNISEFQNRIANHSHHYNIYGENVAFPGDTKEFMEHYEDVQRMVKEIEELAQDAPKGDQILDKLKLIKSVLNQDSDAFTGKKTLEEKLIKAIERLEDRLEDQ
ncbi:MAG TPA: hypothetical protein ENI73_05525 [Spirochaetes bacterium]|nr:hypothetical protein [Spirochaetota bacterium]